MQPFRPKLHMTDADFLSITRNGRLCDGEGGLGRREFELVMREQVPPDSSFREPAGTGKHLNQQTQWSTQPEFQFELLSRHTRSLDVVMREQVRFKPF